MADWDGKKERRNSTSDHDVLIRIDTRLTNFLEKCDDKCIENEKHFDKHSKRIGLLEKAYWLALGILVAVQFILKII